MHLIKLLVLIIIISPAFVAAQEAPGWVERKGISPGFSEDTYISGFGIATFTRNDDPVNINQLAEENAKKNLAEKIKVQVKASTKSLKQQTGYNFEQKLESEVISISEIELLGLKKEFYTDNKNGLAYCLVYVPKSYLVKSYEYKMSIMPKIKRYYTRGLSQSA